MIFITGDTHGDISRIKRICQNNGTTRDDILIILGDAGFNFYPPEQHGTKRLKKQLASLPITLFCIHGNHECRPSNIVSYKESIWNGGTVYIEEAYPNILFAKDGEVFNINGKKYLVIGGAYSVDKYHRLYNWYRRSVDMDIELLSDLYKYIKGEEVDAARVREIDRLSASANSYELYWWKDEQPDEAIKEKVREVVEAHNGEFDYVLTHTCPGRFIPYEAFLSSVNQNSVDNSTEEFLDDIYEKVTCRKWFCGHYHIDKLIDNLIFMFNDVRSVD